MNHNHHEQGNNDMGRVMTEIMVANNQDVQLALRGALPEAEVRRMRLQATVDTGANYLVLPVDVANRLDLPKVGDVMVHYADKRSETRELVGQVEVTLLGRQSTFRAILEPNRTTALIGAIVLEDLDFLVDCGNQKLYARDPSRIVTEVE